LQHIKVILRVKETLLNGTEYLKYNFPFSNFAFSALVLKATLNSTLTWRHEYSTFLLSFQSQLSAKEKKNLKECPQMVLQNEKIISAKNNRSIFSLKRFFGSMQLYFVRVSMTNVIFCTTFVADIISDIHSAEILPIAAELNIKWK